MNLKDSFECQMACSMCFFAVLVTFLVCLCTAFSGCGFLLPLIFTIFFVVLSSAFFTFSKNKPLLMETSVEPKLEPESETTTQPKDSQEAEIVLSQLDGNMVRPMDSFSENESIDQPSITDQDSEEEQETSPDWSNDSISDEESLIEIALPSGHYVGGPNKKEEPKFNLQQKFSDFSLMEILGDINEMNEEDNLIEIDISMGSIKCSRFEIEA
ncbi:hypothetical protein CsSME_00026859 [Camellia sinensis var. sinensis]